MAGAVAATERLARRTRFLLVMADASPPLQPRRSLLV
jgi:hypothetical protein